MKALQTIAAGVLVLGMGSAFSAEPVALSDSQMDNVSAGAAVVASGSGDGWGVAVALTAAQGTAANVKSPLASIGINQSTGIGLGAGITISHPR
ncbi:MAG: hypothetical protein ACXWF8_04895 [Methylobacter sp.]